MASDDKTPLNDSEGKPDYSSIFGEKKEEFAKQTVFGEIRNVKRFTWREWVFVVVATLSLLGVLGFTIERFVWFQTTFSNITIVNGSNGSNVSRLSPCNEWTCTNDFIFAVVVLINLFFCAFYCYDGLFRERPFEMFAYAVAVVVIMLYIIVNYVLNGEEGQPIRLIRLVLVCVFGPVNAVLALVIWWKMGYLIFNTIGTNKTLVWAYRFRSFFLTIQYINMQVLANILILAFVKDGQFITTGEKVILPIFLVFSLFTSLLGAIAVNYEVQALVIVWYFLNSPFLGYYIYKLINVAMDWGSYQQKYVHHYYNTPDIKTAHFTYEYTGAVILIATIIGMVVYALMFVFITLSYKNFGKGLKDKVKPPLEALWHKIKPIENLASS